MADSPSEQEARASLDSVRVGEVRTGRVVGISEQEVLAELDGFPGPESITGRIPGRDLSRRTSGHPSELVDLVRNRISLSARDPHDGGPPR
ncbi:hypothetical protein ABTX85_37990 [Streptomyces sp. NPDC096097]|uniref:hypothetical protein n=1 Tax=Streptomyces sp. NPDC096097 TaxID=3155546 RepID=UPI00332668E2